MNLKTLLKSTPQLPTAWYYDHEGRDAFLRLAGCSKQFAAELANGLQVLGFVCTLIDVASRHRHMGVCFPVAIRVAMPDGRKPAPFLLLPCVAEVLARSMVPPVLVSTEAEAERVERLINGTRTLIEQNHQLNALLAAQVDVGSFRQAMETELLEAEVLTLQSKLGRAHKEYNEMCALWERTDEARRQLALELGKRAERDLDDGQKFKETPLPDPKEQP